MRRALFARPVLFVLVAVALATACNRASGAPAAPTITGCAAPMPCPDGVAWNPLLGPRPVPTAGALDETGSLLFPRRNTLVALDVQTRNITTIAEFPKQASLSSPATSPDRKLVALTVYIPSTDPKDLGGADLYIVDVSDGSSRVLLEHSASGVWLSEPAWTADGQTIYFTRRAAILQDGRYKGEDVTVDRINVDGSGGEHVVQNASSPSLSADGQFLAYLAPVGGTEPAKLWVSNLDGQEPKQVAGSTFSQLATPRFAPTGSKLAFTAVGGPANTPVGTLAGRLDRILGIGIAEAHGIPWDIWVVNADGSGLTRLTDVGEDSPVPTWAPDGSSIAFSGEIGMYMIDPATGNTEMVAQEPSSGVVWVPSA